MCGTHIPVPLIHVPKMPQTSIYKIVWWLSDHHTQKFAKLAKHFKKSLLLQCHSQVLGLRQKFALIYPI